MPLTPARRPVLLSDRNIPLVFQGALHPRAKPMVTVECYLKWYNLFAVHPDGSVQNLGFPEEQDCPADESVCVDHVPNPAAVVAMAHRLGFQVCSESYEILVGRWVTEARNLFPSLAELEARMGEQPVGSPVAGPRQVDQRIQERIIADAIDGSVVKP